MVKVNRVALLLILLLVAAGPAVVSGQNTSGIPSSSSGSPHIEQRVAHLSSEVERSLQSLEDSLGSHRAELMALRKHLHELVALSLRSDDHNTRSAVGRASRERDDFDWEEAYDGLEPLSGAELMAQLRDMVDNHHVLSYRDARRYFFLELDNHDGIVECIYTGRQEHYTDMPDHQDMNCEHTWPQSIGATGVARSDIHHLFPCDSWVNNVRGNLPFGWVDEATWEEGGSRTDGVVFEVRPERRGNIARAIFYFSLRYGLPIGAEQEQVLREWHAQDPPDHAERVRNDGIHRVQRNRNPFVDRPEFIERLGAF